MKNSIKVPQYVYRQKRWEKKKKKLTSWEIKHFDSQENIYSRLYSHNISHEFTSKNCKCTLGLEEKKKNRKPEEETR